ncbi:MAG: bifunctional 5,10-methylenetetrahydrofolate dehydrogenase/5,10-methenyltetrahydrofolate cyclohydrolase [Vicinamibacterales bacterium]
MSARVIDGQAMAALMQQELKPKVAAFAAAHGRPPGLAIVLVGDDPASAVYVGSKLKHGADVGFRTDLERLPATASLDETLALVERLNRSEVHDGILVQAPLPRAMGDGAAQRVFDAIVPEKDVDGFSPVNVGLMVQGRPSFVACTPAGVVEMLEREGIAIAGHHAVVIGRSDTVGKPLALLLLHKNATVTICHSRTPDLASVCRQADILVAAVGRAALVTREFVKPGATVIDVGINKLVDRGVVENIYPAGHRRRGLFDKNGFVLIGDVHPEVAEVAGVISPVPGGVGPLTVTLLMKNTLRAAEARRASTVSTGAGRD